MIETLDAKVVLQGIERELNIALASDCPTLITGEAGMDKETIARWIHDHSRFGGTSLRIINCANSHELPPETALLDGVPSADDTGTLVIKAMEKLNGREQDRLFQLLEEANALRFCTSGTPSRSSPRIISIARTLIDKVRGREFREDLYYRLNIIHIRVPPLRERREGVPELFQHCLDTAADLSLVNRPWLSREASQKLTMYDWPGNLRELRSVAASVVELTGGHVVGAADLPFQ